MTRFRNNLLVYFLLVLFSAAALSAADVKTDSLLCVGLYSETDGGYVSWRVAGKADWTVIKVGDLLPSTAELKISVDRDWVELSPTSTPTVVYEVEGNEKGVVLLKIADLVKGKPRTLAFPLGSAAKPDPKYKDKLVVTRYLGRQIYITKDGDSRNIKYGDLLDISGKVRIIAINNTITLMNASGGVTTVIGPLNFTIEQVLSNKNLYKFLNVQK